MATAEQDHSCTPLGTILVTIISFVDLIRNFHLRQLYKRDHADQNAGPSSAVLPQVPSTNTMLLLPTTKEGHSDWANSSTLSATAISRHASHTLTGHGGDHITEKPDGNQNEPPPVLPVPTIPPTSCSQAGGHRPNICKIAEPSILRLPATSTELHLPPADGRPFPFESKPSVTMLSLPYRPDARNPEDSRPLHSTIARQVSNINDIGGDTLSSRTDDLPVEPIHHPTFGGEEASVVPREIHRMSTSASTATALSGTSSADSLLSLPSSDQQNGILGPRVQQPSGSAYRFSGEPGFSSTWPSTIGFSADSLTPGVTDGELPVFYYRGSSTVVHRRLVLDGRPPFWVPWYWDMRCPLHQQRNPPQKKPLPYIDNDTKTPERTWVRAKL